MFLRGCRKELGSLAVGEPAADERSPHSRLSRSLPLLLSSFFLFSFAVFCVPITNASVSKIHPLRIFLSVSFFFCLESSPSLLFHEWTGGSLGWLHSCHPASSLHSSSVALLFHASSWEKGTWEVNIWNLAYVEVSVFHPLHLIDSVVGYWVLGWESFSFRVSKHHSIVSSGFQCHYWESSAMLTARALTVISVSSAHLEALLVALAFEIFRIMYLVFGLFTHWAGDSVGPSI